MNHANFKFEMSRIDFLKLILILYFGIEEVLYFSSFSMLLESAYDFVSVAYDVSFTPEVNC